MGGRLGGSLVGPDGKFAPRTARILVAVGCALILMGALTLQPGLTRIAVGTRSVARVVACTEPVQRVYTATLEFEPAGGRSMRIERRLSARRVRMLSPGDRVGVAYFPSAPEAAEVADHRAAWAGGSVPLLVGAILAGLSVAYRRKA
jgi:hypothetical protein